MATSEFVIYLGELSQKLKHGDATEHIHRPALKALVESIGKDIVATNEPPRILWLECLMGFKRLFVLFLSDGAAQHHGERTR
jgi:hypothetical protein